MPKITRHGGPTNADDQPPPAPAEPDEAPADVSPPPADDVAEQVEKPKARRTRRKASDATAELTVTAEAEVTRGDSS
ncbi:hypothetical protein ABZ912_19960 [Nonomuraea angiospora]|uniref:hypothetical protein n=1 Tax=Nonomuraea angiospora TaxID=46172 RepID=UPI00340F16EB